MAEGLPGMRERVRSLGGIFAIGSRPDGGVIVEAEFGSGA
jgi:signal transduction histidine kinase